MTERLENLYREHRQGLFTYALSITGCSQMAEDAIQNAFANLYRKSTVKRELENGQLVPYVFRSVKNCAIDLQRTKQRQKRLSESLFENMDQTDNHSTPQEVLLTQERAELLQSAIEELAEPDREAIVLKLFAGLTFDQAGEMTQTSPKTIATRYRRALTKLESQLKGRL